ncbi:hypothetical protein [Sphaerisporangium siamense]|uniref:Uncharacterized protein n=1 Tax=Sphaerisporangium siamense TaxID=795645 RepID=A0A7W7GDT8_9ACTN|nr:hypothetical protein [Sphaerisporangium siamense]MBB4705340.1 hypothetical protein [Sphaerisporangium siamense]
MTTATYARLFLQRIRAVYLDGTTVGQVNVWLDQRLRALHVLNGSSRGPGVSVVGQP